MKRYLMKRFALTEKGAADMLKAITAVTAANIALMTPVWLLFAFTGDYLAGTAAGRWAAYLLLAAACLVLIFFPNYWQYNATFFATYVESGKRRVSLAEKLRKLPLSFFGKKDLADLTSTIMSDAETLEHASSHQIPQFYGSLISTTLICAGLFFYKWEMALAAVWPIPIAIFIVAASKKVQQHFIRRQSESKVRLNDAVQEFIEPSRDLKSCNAEDAYLIELNRKIDDVEKKAIGAELGQAAFIVSAQLILKIGIGTVAVAGSALLMQGRLSVMEFFSFLLVASRLYEPMSGNLINLGMLNLLTVPVERMNEITGCPEQTGSAEFHPDGYDICFEHVGFSYDEGKTVLRDVTFTAKQGQVTALVGPSGGGKTTVSRLAARFWDVSRGRITVGGQDISKIDPETLLSVYSIVFQDVTLFNNSILENIRVGRKDASDDEVLAAARLANCDEFALKLPEGYDTVIGENGSELSGGERQRISIARAFLKDAPVILLDEASASLDVENETVIQEALSRLIRNKTVMVIAHRMRTVSGADKIVVLSDGTIAEEGSPKDLLTQKDSAFHRMACLQTASAEWSI
ncbi:MAG: ABC transporter ATP-binding protein/permease [Clostridiales bacterium]|nr:ABC transporter ATP-binding protein/permease [Clostridiales bacterium]